MSEPPITPRLGPSVMANLPYAVQRPAYDRAAVKAGMAHIGVGAFHRTHQAEYADDLLARQPNSPGLVGINIRPPGLAATLGRQDGLYTRLIRQGDRIEARVIGSIVKVVDSQETGAPALGVLASPGIDVVTMTVTEKAYCHKPATGRLDSDLSEVIADKANPETPRTLPGLVLRALELRMHTHGHPLTMISCDNIPGNGAILGNVVRALAAARDDKLATWVERNVAFPSTMVDRIAPATMQADIDHVERTYGYRDGAVVVGEAFRQWVIEDNFARRRPQWDLVGASFVADVTPYEHIKMRILNGAQTALSYFGVLAGHEYSFEAVGDPLLETFVRRMLVEESVPTLEAVPGMPALPYVDQSLARLHNTAIRHRCHQIATDGSQKIVQRLLNPIRERLLRGQSIELLAVPVAAWMAYLILASARFGGRWKADDPHAAGVAAIADRIGDDTDALASAILAIHAIFDPELAANQTFQNAAARGLSAMLSNDPMDYLREILRSAGPTS